MYTRGRTNAGDEWAGVRGRARTKCEVGVGQERKGKDWEQNTQRTQSPLEILDKHASDLVFLHVPPTAVDVRQSSGHAEDSTESPRNHPPDSAGESSSTLCGRTCLDSTVVRHSCICKLGCVSVTATAVDLGGSRSAD